MAADYIELLRHPFWQKKKNSILERDKYTCQRCKDEFSNLQVHHTFYKKDNLPWEYPDDSLITLCELCHIKAEFEKWMHRKGQAALIRLGLTTEDIEEVIEFIVNKTNRNFYKDEVLQYIEDIKFQLNG